MERTQWMYTLDFILLVGPNCSLFGWITLDR